jgi:hypothetical protein
LVNIELVAAEELSRINHLSGKKTVRFGFRGILAGCETIGDTN